LQGSADLAIRFPRASPWAREFEPFGLTRHRRTSLWASVENGDWRPLSLWRKGGLSPAKRKCGHPRRDSAARNAVLSCNSRSTRRHALYAAKGCAPKRFVGAGRRAGPCPGVVRRVRQTGDGVVAIGLAGPAYTELVVVTRAGTASGPYTISGRPPAFRLWWRAGHGRHEAWRMIVATFRSVE
jgi:hypothetical protein